MTNDLLSARAAIDDIDTQIVGLLAQRFAITRQVGLHKKEQQLPLIDAAREARQMAHIAELARTAGLNPNLAQAILRLVIDETVRNHQRIQGDE